MGRRKKGGNAPKNRDLSPATKKQRRREYDRIWRTKKDNVFQQLCHAINVKKHGRKPNKLDILLKAEHFIKNKERKIEKLSKLKNCYHPNFWRKQFLCYWQNDIFLQDSEEYFIPEPDSCKKSDSFSAPCSSPAKDGCTENSAFSYNPDSGMEVIEVILLNGETFGSPLRDLSAKINHSNATPNVLKPTKKKSVLQDINRQLNFKNANVGSTPPKRKLNMEVQKQYAKKSNVHEQREKKPYPFVQPEINSISNDVYITVKKENPGGWMEPFPSEDSDTLVDFKSVKPLTGQPLQSDGPHQHDVAFENICKKKHCQHQLQNNSVQKNSGFSEKEENKWIYDPEVSEFGKYRKLWHCKVSELGFSSYNCNKENIPGAVYPIKIKEEDMSDVLPCLVKPLPRDDIASNPFPSISGASYGSSALSSDAWCGLHEESLLEPPVSLKPTADIDSYISGQEQDLWDLLPASADASVFPSFHKTYLDPFPGYNEPFCKDNSTKAMDHKENFIFEELDDFVHLI